jgi:hypothetical protein
MLLEDTSQELDIKVVSQTHVLHPRARLVSLCTHARGPYHPFPHLLPSWGPALTVLLQPWVSPVGTSAACPSLGTVTTRGKQSCVVSGSLLEIAVGHLCPISRMMPGRPSWGQIRSQVSASLTPTPQELVAVSI